MEEIDFESDKFEDVLAKDGRYNARAYAMLANVLAYLGKSKDGKEESKERHFSGQDIMDEFRETALDQYGPMAYTVLTEWGLKSCEDIGEMMFNLVDTGRIERDEEDTPETFLGGYDFKEAFLGPYET